MIFLALDGLNINTIIITPLLLYYKSFRSFFKRSWEFSSIYQQYLDQVSDKFPILARKNLRLDITT